MQKKSVIGDTAVTALLAGITVGLGKKRLVIYLNEMEEKIMEEKADEILEHVGKLREIANELYIHGCTPEDFIICIMNSHLHSIESILNK